MSPKGKKAGHSKDEGRRIRALGKAGQKLDDKEAAQDAKSGKRGKPAWGPGRQIRDGWRGAKS